MVDRRDRPIVTLFHGDSFAEGDRVALGDEAVRHARVRRVESLDAIRLVDGEGHVGMGHVNMVGRDSIHVSIDQVTLVPRPEPLDVIIAVADRDRMLLAAEKCVELQVTGWHPASFARSRSVTPRGEGRRFREKVRARMQSALEQSGGAWLPVIAEESEAIDALRVHAARPRRILLDVSGEPLPDLVDSVPTVIAVGPEGGLEPQELAAAAEGGWALASLCTTTLRFETAVIAAAAVIRAVQLTHRSS